MTPIGEINPKNQCNQKETNCNFTTMIIYNDTVILDNNAEQEWLTWMKEEHIPAIMATGHFSSYRILSIIDSPNDGVTYCVQYNADTIEQFQEYYSKHLLLSGTSTHHECLRAQGRVCMNTRKLLVIDSLRQMAKAPTI